jgi:hypothetical protein
MKPGASEFCSLCPECSKTHLRASSISKKNFRLAIARHEGREKRRRGRREGRGGRERNGRMSPQNVSHGDANDGVTMKMLDLKKKGIAVGILFFFCGAELKIRLLTL